MQDQRPTLPPKTHPDVELVRLYTERDHPWLGLVALARRMGLIGVFATLVVGLARMVIERVL